MMLIAVWTATIAGTLALAVKQLAILVWWSVLAAAGLRSLVTLARMAPRR